MGLEVSSDRAVCYRCGKMYGKKRGNFPVSYAVTHKGSGFLHVCRTCVGDMYEGYLKECGDSRLAVRQMCRKLDLYWAQNIYDSVVKKSTVQTTIYQYLAKLSSDRYAGKSYDDTLRSEGLLWEFGRIPERVLKIEEPVDVRAVTDQLEEEVSDDISEDVIAYWGSGYSPAMYQELEKRREAWVANLPPDSEPDARTDALIRQICSLEIDINRMRSAGRSVDKSVTALNGLISSFTKLQKKQDDTDMSMADTPLGVWLYRYENQRPLPEVDPELQDVNGIKRYVFTWMGHLCKMLGLKNGYTKLYEDEIAKWRVDKPEYDGEDDESFYEGILTNSLSEPDGDDEI